MKKVLCLLLAIIFPLALLASCGEAPAAEEETTTKEQEEETTAVKEEDLRDTASEAAMAEALERFADNAYQDIVNCYWNEEGGFFWQPNNITWEVTMGLLSMETYELGEKTESVLKAFMERFKREKQMIYAKDRGLLLATSGGYNPAHDDAAWTCMMFMLFYRHFHDEESLELAHELLKRSYACWADGDTEHGMWYKFIDFDVSKGPEYSKSGYCVGFILTELEYYALTKGTDKEDKELHEDTMALYRWVEKYLRRDGVRVWNGKSYNVDDKLYFLDFNDDPATGMASPNGITNPQDINPAGSCSALFLNTGMAVVNKRLYDLTGDNAYRKKALETANALVTSRYNNAGCLVNDRDAWTNCAFLGFFAREVVPMEGINPELPRMFMRTALSIVRNCRFEGGFYGADWQGGDRWYFNQGLGNPRTFMITATTTHMLFAARYLASTGVIRVTESDLSLIPATVPTHPFMD